MKMLFGEAAKCGSYEEFEQTKWKFFRFNLGFYIAKAGLKQRDLATAVDVSEATVSQWLSGKKKPRGDKMDRIAHALNVPVWDLFE